MNSFLPFVLVGLGGFAGSTARYGASIVLQRYSTAMPAGTMTVNILGCFLIGLITQISSQSSSLSPEMRLLLATGFCGGFTTMSSFFYELSELVKTDEYYYAAVYFGATLAGSALAFYIGCISIKLFIKFAGGLWN